MENKEYIQDLKKLINGEMVAAMQYKAIADSIVGEKSLSYIQTHCDEHYQEELGHYTLLVNALMQREGSTELNLSSIVGEALPETVEMTSNNCMDAAEFFSKSEDAAIKAYLDFHEKIKDVDPDLDDIIIGIISDERDHKLDFDRVLNSDEELETEETEEEMDDSNEDELDDSESEDNEPEKKDKFNFDFSDDEDEKVEESRKMIRNRVRENNKKRLKEGPGGGYTLKIEDLELLKDTVKIVSIEEGSCTFTVDVQNNYYKFSASHSYWEGEEWAQISGTLTGIYTPENEEDLSSEFIDDDDTISKEKDNKYLIDDIKSALPRYVTVDTVYSRGWFSIVPDKDFILEDNKWGIVELPEPTYYYFEFISFEGHSNDLGDYIEMMMAEDDEDEEIEESRKMRRNRVREKSSLNLKDFKKKILGVFRANNVEVTDYYFDDDDSGTEVFYVETDNTNQYRLSNLMHSLHNLIKENPELGYDDEEGDNGFYSRKYVFYIYDDLEESRKIRKRSLKEEKERWYYGIPGIRMIWHGEWADPEVCYNDKFVNEPSVVDTMWDIYKEECEDEGKPVDEDYFDNHYMKDHADEVKDLILDLPSTREDDLDEDEDFEDDSEEFEEFVNRKINKVREKAKKPSRNFVERRLHNKEKYSDSINKFARRIR